MGLIFAIILGLLVAESVGVNTSNKQTKETTQESANTVVVKKPIILEVKSDPKPEPAKEEIKSLLEKGNVDDVEDFISS